MRGTTQNAQDIVDASALNPRKPYYKVSYRNDILRFVTPGPADPASQSPIPFSYTPISATSFRAAGYTAGNLLNAMSFTPSATGGPDLSAGTTLLNAAGVNQEAPKATIMGSWKDGIYYFASYTPLSSTIRFRRTTSSTNFTVVDSGAIATLPNAFITNTAGAVRGSAVRPSARIVMEHNDQLVVMTSYKFMAEINQMVCTMTFYHASPNSTTFRRLRTVIQYESPEDPTTSGLFDPLSGRVFAASYSAGKFFVIANDGTKAIRFVVNEGVEGMAEPIIPIDIDANRLEITDSSTGTKTYGKYHQFMPSSLTRINGLYYLTGQMTRTYSNGDRRVMEIYLWSVDGVNWSVGDVSSFIDAHYYKRSESVKLRNYSLVYWPDSSTMYALGSGCGTSAAARETDAGAPETDFSDTVISGSVQNTTNSADKADILVMKGFDTVDPTVLGGKTISINLGYYNASNAVRSVKMGEYFVESELHELSSFGRGPNKVTATDSASWKLMRWSSMTDIDRWSSTFIRDDLKALSKLIIKGISSDYSAVDNATGTGLYLNNLNDPFVGYTSTRDDRDGMFTVCARFIRTGTGSNATAKLSSIGLLIGAEDYTDIYTKGAADRKGFNAVMIPAESTWTGKAKTQVQMRKSNLKRRVDDPTTTENESDTDKAFQWIRRYTSLWERGVYTTDTDSPYNTITSAAATGDGNVVYAATGWSAEHNTDYEFVMRRHSGRIQTFARKKGRTADTVAATGNTEYTLLHQYQFTKDDRINWGPRPFWGFVAGTDVFASLEGWNSREYGNIESTITEAYNSVGFENNEVYLNFPDSMLVSSGKGDAAQGTYTYKTTSETTWVWNEREPSSGGGYYDKVTTSNTTASQTSNANAFYLVEECTHNGRTISVGEIVRVFGFLDAGAVGNNCTLNNIIRPPLANPNVDPKQEFIGIIGSIENIASNPPTRKIRFVKTWNGIFANPKQYGSDMRYAMYKLGPGSSYAKLSSGSISANFMTAVGSPTIPVDIKTGGVKQASVSAGRAAVVNRQNDAIFIRMMDSDGSSHLMYDASNYTKLGFDWPTTPISKGAYVGSFVDNDSDVSTRDWRLLMYQGRLFPMSSTQFGLPDGLAKAYMIKGDEIVRYTNWGFASRAGTAGDTVWCIIPAFYTPIFPSVKGSTTVQQWSVFSNLEQAWIEPGDKFNEIQSKSQLSGLRVYINSKGGYSSIDGEQKCYAVSATSASGGTASTLTFAPALKAGADAIDPATERAKDADKQLKEIAVVSGREQFDTSPGLQSYTDPLCYYPVGSDATSKADAFIKVNYWTMSAGLYNSAKDNLKYACNLAGISDVQFMDSVNTMPATAANFLIELTGTVTTSSVIVVNMRNAYRLEIDVNASGILTLILSTQAGFAPAANLSVGNAAARVIARVSVPVSDVELAGTRDFRIILRKEKLMVEMDMVPVWTFDLKTYKFGGSKFDQFDLYTDQEGALSMTLTSVSNSSYKVVELSEEVENQIIDMSQSGGEAVQFITKERHIHVRSTANGGLQFGRFMDGNRTNVSLTSGGAAVTENFIKDQLEYNPFQVPGHVLVTGAEYGEHLDPEWIRQNGYLFASNQNRLLDTVEDSIREAKLLIRMSKEDSDNSDLEMIGLPHIQPEDGLNKVYSFPETVAADEQAQIVSGHAIQFDQSSLRSSLKIRRKYSLE